MSIAALIRSMAAAGASAEAIAIAVDAIEAASMADAQRRAAQAERKQRQRDKDRDSHGTVTGQSRDTPSSPLVPPSLSPTPPISPPYNPPTIPEVRGARSELAPPAKASPKARGSRIPRGWLPSPDDRQSARSEGMPESEIDRTAAKFRDFWAGKAGASGVKLDWPATWRNWVRSDCEKRGWAPIAQTATGPPDTPTPTGWRPGLPTDAELRAKYAKLQNPDLDEADHAPVH